MPTGISTLINKKTFVTLNCRELVASKISRSGLYGTKDKFAKVYDFKIGLAPGLKYSDNRDTLTDLYDRQGTTNEETITIGNSLSTNDNPSTNDKTISYLGNIAGGSGFTLGTQLNSILIVQGNAGDKEFKITMRNVAGLGSVGTSYKVFAAGDYFRPKGTTGNYRYPYQVTEDVLYTVPSSPSTAANLTVKVNRPIIAQDGIDFNITTGPIYGGGVSVAEECRWIVKINKMPNYAVTPHDLIEWDSNLEVIEVIT